MFQDPFTEKWKRLARHSYITISKVISIKLGQIHAGPCKFAPRISSGAYVTLRLVDTQPDASEKEWTRLAKPLIDGLKYQALQGSPTLNFPAAEMASPVIPFLSSANCFFLDHVFLIRYY